MTVATARHGFLSFSLSPSKPNKTARMLVIHKIPLQGMLKILPTSEIEDGAITGRSLAIPANMI